MYTEQQLKVNQEKAFDLKYKTEKSNKNTIVFVNFELRLTISITCVYTKVKEGHKVKALVTFFDTEQGVRFLGYGESKSGNYHYINHAVGQALNVVKQLEPRLNLLPTYRESLDFIDFKKSLKPLGYIEVSRN